MLQKRKGVNGKMRKLEQNKCVYCQKLMLPSYKGVNKKYCSRKCNDDYRRSVGYFKAWYQNKQSTIERNKRLCAVCKRNIKKVGKKSNIYKYCSNRCMQLCDRIKKGQKTVTVEIPIELFPSLFEN